MDHLTKVQTAKFGGQIIGIVIGCILGMFPLLLIDEKDD